MSTRTVVDASRQHLTDVQVTTYDPGLHLADEVTVRTDNATITLPDPIGLWEQLTDALRATHGDHMAQWLTAPNGPTEPTPSLRLAGEPTDPGSVIRAGVKA